MFLALPLTEDVVLNGRDGDVVDVTWRELTFTGPSSFVIVQIQTSPHACRRHVLVLEPTLHVTSQASQDGRYPILWPVLPFGQPGMRLLER